VDRAAARASYPWAILAGVLLGAQFFSGWMQNQIYYVGAIVLCYTYFCILKMKSGSGRARLSTLRRSVSLSAITLVTGFGLAATQWVPVMELLSHSNRRIVPTEIGYIYLPPWYLGTFIFPNLFGSADDARALRLFTALSVSHDHILYISIAALAPLAYCIYWLKRAGKAGERDDAFQARASLFLIMAGISLVIMMAAPLYVHVTRYIPVLQVIRVIVRAWVLFIFAASVLVAFGSKLLLESSRDRVRPLAVQLKRFATLTAVCVAVAVAASYMVKLAGIVYEEGGSGKLAYLRRAAGLLSEQFTPPRFDIVFPLLLLFMLAALLHRYASGSLSRRTFLAIFLALLGVDLIWVSTQFNPTFDRSRIFPSTLITDRLRELPPGRVLVAPSVLETNRRVSEGGADRKIIAPPNTLLPYRIPAVAGKNQQFPRWYRDYASLIEPQPYLSHVVFDRTDSPFFDLLNVKYILTHNWRDAPEASELLLSAEGISLYENRSAMPRAFLVSGVIEVKDQAGALEALKDPAFDPKQAVVIETGRSARSEAGAQAGSAKIIEDKRNRLVVECEAISDAMLVVSDNYYPGWEAYVDGRPAEVFKANCTMRAVKVEPGRHVVSFEFVPATFRISIYVTAVTLALVSIALAGIWIGHKRRDTPERGI
ncbi:MAG TPA: YfhO family protein, partial [Blastocatellia bacterium]|nr:YfhO family protein [Blastocatellia bacterium]